jgi:hypothetical protein
MQCHVECDGPQATGTLEFGTPELELETQNQNSVLLLVSVQIGKDCNFFFFVQFRWSTLVYLFLIFVIGYPLCQLCSKYLFLLICVIKNVF